MRFHVSGVNARQCFIGSASNRKDDPARRFCDAYRSLAKEMFTTSTLRLEAAVWNRDGQVPEPEMRYAYSEDEEPEIFRAVFECLGYEPSEFDVVVMYPEGMIGLTDDTAAMLLCCMHDAASVLTDEGVIELDLGKFGPDIMRTALTAMLLRSCEALLPPSASMDGAYDTVRALSFSAITKAHYSRMNGMALLVRENPGMVSLIDQVVSEARSVAPLPLPVSAVVLQEQSEELLRSCLAETRLSPRV